MTHKGTCISSRAPKWFSRESDDQRTDRRTDATKYIISLASQSIITVLYGLKFSRVANFNGPYIVPEPCAIYIAKWEIIAREFLTVAYISMNPA